ncbi:ATP adenylyltransferase [Prochlorococcus sp. MIT 1223]|uniref:ATP adenylyltransferase n=1 Tax=Prochlorococcus sp. MIT 1223 TaxID=3096217 RepID=UPI002A758E87|nr:ATP adenylyltransferase [Prochlorococcus sp. MIT 1223]
MYQNSLWDRVLRTNQKALQSNAIRPFKTKLERYLFEGYEYELRSLIGKPRTQNSKIGPNKNPFLPWERELEVAKVNNDHVLILNKYPVELGHLLLITKYWAPQNGWLTYKDWQALASVESKIDGFWFFNNSENSGASQPHRHLQLLYRKGTKYLFPRQRWFEDHLQDKNHSNSSLVRSVSVKRRYYYRDKSSADELDDLYKQVCEEMKIGNTIVNTKPSISYNLIITSDWISLIRRSKESYKGFNINALGFAGYFLITFNSDLSWLRRNSPLSILNEVVIPL